VRPPDGDIDVFTSSRPRLVRLAYRMLGSVAEAEDVVQDAYVRWHRADRALVREPAAFLTRMVTRLCLDVLKSARMRRETYIGPWLPEPVVDGPDAEEGEDVTLALMMALERLSPLERAAFLLHDVFGMDFDQIASAIGRDAAACRQLAHRARAHVRAARPRFPVPEEQGRTIAEAFLSASATGDLAALQSLLAKDVVFYADGGGKRSSALNPIRGPDRVARFFAGLARKPHYGPPTILRAGRIDGLPGFVAVDAKGVLQTMAFAIDGGRITAIYITRNPDKLKHLPEAAGYEGLSS
jgi:RNA polymerase sigma-70 factor (ECF subfamily)